MTKKEFPSKRQSNRNAAKKKQDHAVAERKASESQVAMGWIHPATLRSLGIKQRSLFHMSKAQRYAVLGVTSQPRGPRRRKVANFVKKALNESGSPKDIKAALKESGLTKDERSLIKSAAKHHDPSRLTQDVEGLVKQSEKRAAQRTDA